MKFKIEMHFELSLESKELFLDELILKAKQVFCGDGIGKFVGLILESVE